MDGAASDFGFFFFTLSGLGPLGPFFFFFGGSAAAVDVDVLESCAVSGAEGRNACSSAYKPKPKRRYILNQGREETRFAFILAFDAAGTAGDA